MKRLILPLLCFFMLSYVSSAKIIEVPEAVARMSVMTVGGGAPAAGGGLEREAEDFDPTFATNCATASGYEDQSFCDNETEGGISQLLQDSATAYSGEALHIDYADSATATYTYDEYTAETGDHYHGFRFYTTLTAGTTDVFSRFFEIEDATNGVTLVADVFQKWDDEIVIRFESPRGAYPQVEASVTAGTWYTVCIFYPATGSDVPAYSIDGAALTDIGAVEAETNGIDLTRFGATNAGNVNSTYDVYIDDYGICTTGSNCYCP